MTSAGSRYSNFDDAWGLVARMLRSGEASAFWALGLAAAGIAATPIDRLLAGRERRLIEAADETTGPLVLIVGAPRSGTTLAYQVLASHLDVSAITNATALFGRSPISGTALLGDGTPGAAAGYRSYYGNSAGLRAPNDGFSVWNRWLGSDRYRTVESIDDADAKAMRQFFSAWRTRFGRPLLNKNNRNADCVPQLARALPEAVFVEIHRDPVAVVNSLLKARETVQGDVSRGWGLRANDEAANVEDPIDAVARQVQLVRSTLDAARDSVPSDRYLRIAYEDFCENPADFVRSVADTFEGVSLNTSRTLDQLEPFKVSRAHGFSDAELGRIDAILKGMP